MENMQEKEVDLVLQVKLGPIFLKKKNEETDNRLFSYFACVWEIHLKPIHNGYRNTWVEI